jgi:hypothetical protein
MIFAFGFVTGIGFAIMALLIMMLDASARADQALDSEFVPVWQGARAAGIDGPPNMGGGKRADAAAIAAASNG